MTRRSTAARAAAPNIPKIPATQVLSRLRAAAMTVLGASDIKITPSGLAEPRILAAALLSRTLSNYRGVIALAKMGLLVEARTLTRSCFENVLWIRRLQAEGDVFVQAVLADHRHQDANFARSLLPTSDFLDDEERDFLKGKAGAKGGKRLFLSDGASADGAREEYILFKQFSNEHTHTSALSLSRHVVLDPATGEVSLLVEPSVEDADLLTTLYYASAAVINLMEMYADVTGTRVPGEATQTLAAELFDLAKESGVNQPSEEISQWDRHDR
jgi:hypothetical protein